MSSSTTESVSSTDVGRGAPTAARRRKSLTGTSRVVIGDLSPAARAELCEKAFAVYQLFKKGVDLATFQNDYFRDEKAILVLYHGDGGELAGFLFVTLLHVELAGRPNAVVSAAAFIDTRYKASGELTLSCIMEALRFKLRLLRTPLSYLSVVTTPASYRRFCLQLDEFYPSPRAATPPDVAVLIQAAGLARGLTFVDRERGLVESRGSLRFPERLLNAETLKDDPYVSFYLKHNPRFDQGIGALVWVPLDTRNILSALARYVFRGARS